MKGNLVKFFKSNGFYAAIVVGAIALFAVIGIAGYQSGQSTDEVAENAAGFSEGEPEPQNDQQDVAVNDTVADNDQGLDYTEEYDADQIQDIINQIEAAKADENADDITDDGVAANAGAAVTPFEESMKMGWPVDGEIILDYSMDNTVYYKTLDQYRVNPGVLIQADVNEPVQAAYGGTVENIYSDAQLGTIIVVNMGNGYTAYYAQVKDATVSIGDTVTKGQQIAIVAQPTKYYTEEGSHVNFRMTKDDQTVDPKNYFE